MESPTRNNLAEKRFELQMNGHLAVLEYDMEGDALVLKHTRVPPELEGQGVGSKLVKKALAHAEDQGMKIVPRCPFVAAYIERHPEFRRLLR